MPAGFTGITINWNLPAGGRPGRALDMCNRSFPDPLGIAVWFDKLEFSGFAELTIDN